jgi:hypothetical protein
MLNEYEKPSKQHCQILFTPAIVASTAESYGLSGGISLAALFGLLTGIWIRTFPETKGRKIVA